MTAFRRVGVVVDVGPPPRGDRLKWRFIGEDATSFAGRQKVSVVLGDLSSALYNSADQTTATVTIVVRAGSAGTLVNDAMVTAANPSLVYQPAPIARG